MKILALDQATKRTGAAFIQDGELVSLICLKTRNKLTGEAAQKEMIEEIGLLVTRLSPDIVILEGVHIDEAGNAHTALVLAELLGMIKVTLWGMGVRVMIISSHELTEYLFPEAKRVVGIPRPIKKHRSLDYAKIELDSSGKDWPIMLDDNLADAINLARTAEGRLKVEAWERLL